MSEDEWVFIRGELLKQFQDEDVVQQTLLELLEELAKGVVVLEPLHWCRVKATRLKAHAKFDARLHRETRETLASLGIQCNGSSQRDDTNARQRRKRRRDRKEAA